MKTHVIVDNKNQIDKFKSMLKKAMFFMNERYRIKNNTHVVLNNGNRIIFMEEKDASVYDKIKINGGNRNYKLYHYIDNENVTVWGKFIYKSFNPFSKKDKEYKNYMLYHDMIDIIADILNLNKYLDEHGYKNKSIIHWYFETQDSIRRQKSEAKFIRWHWNREADNYEKRAGELKNKIIELENNFKNK